MTLPTITSVARQQARRAPAVLTDRGAATVALIRFERAWEALAPADRACFAESLAQLAGEAGTARKVA
jgi:hypothetical protein